MCTLHVFNSANKKQHCQAIAREWKTNSDGGSVIMLDDEDNVYLRAQCVELVHLVRLIMTSDASRYCVHLRSATTDVTGVSGCHFFDSPEGEWVYAHNGIIDNPERHRVDSMSLGGDLDDCRKEVFPDWKHHSFCNVIAVRVNHCRQWGDVFIHRSYHGSLYHSTVIDSWATNKLDDSFEPVVPGWHDIYGTVLQQYPIRSKPLTVSRFRYRSALSPQWDKNNSGIMTPKTELVVPCDSEEPIDGMTYCESCQYWVDHEEIKRWHNIDVCDLCLRSALIEDSNNVRIPWGME